MANILKTILKYEPGTAPADAAPAVADGAAATGEPQIGAEARQLIVLGKTLTLKGELSADEDLVLLGRVEGSIVHTGSLTIGSGGVVVGDIRAHTVHIKGTVEGDVVATDSITIDVNSAVSGDVTAPSVSVVEGAKFNGSVSMPAPSQAIAAEPVGPRHPFDGEYVVSARALDRMLSGR